MIQNGDRVARLFERIDSLEHAARVGRTAYTWDHEDYWAPRPFVVRVHKVYSYLTLFMVNIATIVADILSGSVRRGIRCLPQNE